MPPNAHNLGHLGITANDDLDGRFSHLRGEIVKLGGFFLTVLRQNLPTLVNDLTSRHLSRFLSHDDHSSHLMHRFVDEKLQKFDLVFQELRSDLDRLANRMGYLDPIFDTFGGGSTLLGALDGRLSRLEGHLAGEFHTPGASSSSTGLSLDFLISKGDFWF